MAYEILHSEGPIIVIASWVFLTVLTMTFLRKYKHKKHAYLEMHTTCFIFIYLYPTMVL